MELVVSKTIDSPSTVDSNLQQYRVVSTQCEVHQRNCLLTAAAVHVAVPPGPVTAHP